MKIKGLSFEKKVSSESTELHQYSSVLVAINRQTVSLEQPMYRSTSNLSWCIALISGVAAGVAFVVSCGTDSGSYAQDSTAKTSLSTTVDAISQQVATLASQVTTQSKQIDSLTAQNADLTSRVTSLEQKVVSLTSRVTSLEQRMPQFKATTASATDGGLTAASYNACKAGGYSNVSDCTGACQYKCKGSGYPSGIYTSEYSATALNCVCIQYP